MMRINTILKAFQILKYHAGLALGIGIVLVTGCNKDKKDPLKGDREAVLFDLGSQQSDIHNDHTEIILPQGVPMTDWPVVGGNLTHNLPVIQLPKQLDKIWSKSIGSGSGGEARLLNGPIANGKVIFTVDTAGAVTATDLNDGSTIWQVNTTDEYTTSANQAFSGGLAYANGLLFCTTPSAEIVIINAKTGDITKRLLLTAPARAAPTVSRNHVLAVTINNQTEVFNYETGDPVWTHQGILENVGLLGGSAPAVGQNTVIIPYTSGEVYALNEFNGAMVWSESLTDTTRLDPVSTIFHIKARPVIVDDKVYLVSHGGLTKAVNLLNGSTLWQKNVGGIRSPAIGGNYMFMLTNQQQLMCINRLNGQTVWSHQLNAYQDPENKKEPILWIGPILTTQGCLLLNSLGEVVTATPQNGQITPLLDIKERCLLSPIIVSDTLIILTDNGELIAYR